MSTGNFQIPLGITAFCFFLTLIQCRYKRIVDGPYKQSVTLSVTMDERSRIEFVRPYVSVANGAHAIAGCVNWLL